MAYGTGGTYTQVSGAITAASGQVIQSAVWNNIHTDLGGALTAIGQAFVGFPVWRNALYANGGFEVWQRGAGGSASFTVNASTTQYVADRWYVVTGANQQHTISQQAGIVTGSQWCAQIQRVAAQTGTTAMTFGYPLDLDEVARIRGQKVALSFVAKAGANWSPTSGTLTATLYVGTGAVTKALNGASAYSSPTTVLAISANLTQGGSATTVSGTASATIPATTTQAEVQFTWTPTGTAGPNDWVQIDDVMLDYSAAPANGLISSYERLPLDLQIHHCKRHFWKSFAYATAPAQNVGAATGEMMGLAGKAAATAGFVFVRNPVTMRAGSGGGVTTYNPAAANAQVRDETAGADCSAAAVAGSTTEGFYLTLTGNGSTAVGNLLGVHITNDQGI